MAKTTLERLLFLQQDLCFFCKAPLPKAEASIEHLLATAHGGSNHDANRVACCKKLNQWLGSMPLKEKIEFILRQDGGFRCPNGKAPKTVAAELAPLPPAGALPTAAPAEAALQKVVENLKRRGKARPANDTRLRSTIEVLREQQKLGCSVDEILFLLVNRGLVAVDGAGKVTYRL